MTSQDFNFDFRPDYWSPEDALTAIRGNIKGQLRRELIADIVTGEAARMVRESGGDEELQAFMSEVQPGLLANELDDPGSLGRIHPAFLGGEFLPDYVPGEVEIARVVLASVMSDVISIRAHPDDGRIHYRVVDEHEEEDRMYRLSQETSPTPLSMRELITLIDTVEYESYYEADYRMTGLTDSIRYYQDDEDAAVNFVSIQSDFYPELELYYDQQSVDWLLGLRSAPFLEELQVRSIPPLHPLTLESGRRVGTLTESERKGIERWLRLVEGYSRAEIQWSPGGKPQWIRQEERPDVFEVTVGREPGPDERAKWTRRLNQSATCLPTIHECFAAYTSAAASLDPAVAADRIVNAAQAADISPSSLFGLGDDAWSIGDTALAGRCFEKALTVETDLELLVDLAAFYAGIGATQQVVDTCRSALELAQDQQNEIAKAGPPRVTAWYGRHRSASTLVEGIANSVSAVLFIAGLKAEAREVFEKYGG